LPASAFDHRRGAGQDFARRLAAAFMASAPSLFAARSMSPPVVRGSSRSAADSAPREPLVSCVLRVVMPASVGRANDDGRPARKLLTCINDRWPHDRPNTGRGICGFRRQGALEKSPPCQYGGGVGDSHARITARQRRPRYRHTAEDGAPYETIAVDKLTPIIGAEIDGIDLAQPLSNASRTSCIARCRELRHLLP